MAHRGISGNWRSYDASKHLLTDEVSEQVRQRQVGQVDVGGRLHVLVAPDDGADGGVSQDADGADAGVHRGDGDDGRQGQVPRAKAAGDVEVLKKDFRF